MKRKKFAPTQMRYRDYNNEKPPSPPTAESKEERLKRVLHSMPASIFDNPELRLKALKKAHGKEN